MMLYRAITIILVYLFLELLLERQLKLKSRFYRSYANLKAGLVIVFYILISGVTSGLVSNIFYFHIQNVLTGCLIFSLPFSIFSDMKNYN